MSFLSRRQVLFTLAASSCALFAPQIGLLPAFAKSNCLLCYFSRTGNTRTVAEFIHSALGCDSIELVPTKPYPSEYQLCVDQAKREQKEKARPTIKTPIPDLAKYPTILVGYPNWWGTMPMLLFTFFESGNFAGKTILPFCTHGGSAMGTSEADIKKLCPKATVREGLAIKGTEAANARKKVLNWLAKNGLSA